MSSRAEPPSDGNAPAHASTPPLSAPSSNTTVSSTVASSSSPPTSASPPMSTQTSRPPPAITLDAIERARVTLQARAQAAAANECSADYEDVVVALDVTAEDVDKVPSEWLGALKLQLCADGAAIITHPTSNAHGGACGAVELQVAAYAGVNAGLIAARSPLLPMGRGNAQPDVGLFQRVGKLRTRDNLVAIAVFKIEDKGRTGSEIIRTAAEYLTHLQSVECVVSFKLFHPRLHHVPNQRPNDLYVPALALVFRRGVGTVEDQRGQVFQRVRVTQARSFGNAGIDGRYLRSFRGLTTHRLLDQQLTDSFENGLLGFAGPLDAMNLEESLDEAMEVIQLMNQQRLERPIPVDGVMLRVAMPAPLAAIPVDLALVFKQAILIGVLDPLPAEDPMADAPLNANAAVGNLAVGIAMAAPLVGFPDDRFEDFQFLLDMMPAGDIDGTATNAEGHDDADVDMGDP